MTKQDYCNKKTLATYTITNNIVLELKHIEWNIDDTLYFICRCNDKISYHKSKLYYGNDNVYFYFNKNRINLNECPMV